MSEPRPGYWVRERTNSGWHLVLRAANGEHIVWSENYDRPETVTEALAIVVQSTFTVEDDRGQTFSGVTRDFALRRAESLLSDSDVRKPVDDV